MAAIAGWNKKTTASECNPSTGMDKERPDEVRSLARLVVSAATPTIKQRHNGQLPQQAPGSAIRHGAT